MIDIQKIAEQAGFKIKNFKPPVITAQHSNGSWVSVGDELERFAALYREALIAELVAGSGEPSVKAMTTFNEEITFLTDMYMKEQLAGAVLREREKNAKVCEAEATVEGIAQKCAAAIRSGE